MESPVADYPFGDAVHVYRAVLDLLYKGGQSRPGVIVMRDSAIFRYAGICGECQALSTQNERIDPSTIEGFASIPPVKPRTRKFDYDVPIAFVTTEDLAQMSMAGRVYDSLHAHDHLPRLGETDNGYDREFLRRYPGAWGFVDFSLVGFNRPHTEALVQVREFCTVSCHSFEIVFLHKVNGAWRPSERIPQEITYERGLFPYLGPGTNSAAKPELLVESLGAPLRSYLQDEAPVYRAVLDSLYNFHGQRPSLIVIGGLHVHAHFFLPNSASIDSSTSSSFAFQSAIPDVTKPNFDYRIPTVIVTSDSLRALDSAGVPLERVAARIGGNNETAGFWLAFAKHYPGAWGYVEFSRIGYNPEHTQALVYASHQCGSACTNADVWLLSRSGETWSVAARTEDTVVSGHSWFLDSLRYLGKAADSASSSPLD